MRVPSSTPAGTFTLIECFFGCSPSPRHPGHGSLITVPVPLHREHVLATEKNPCWNRTCPRPPHCVQVAGALPFCAPVPLQSSHVSILRIDISFSVPNTA